MARWNYAMAGGVDHGWWGGPFVGYYSLNLASGWSQKLKVSNVRIEGIQTEASEEQNGKEPKWMKMILLRAVEERE